MAIQDGTGSSTPIRPGNMAMPGREPPSPVARTRSMRRCRLNQFADWRSGKSRSIHLFYFFGQHRRSFQRQSKILRAWDFAYKASFVWDELAGFNGHYNDVHHELLLVATRGSCLPESQKLIPSIVHCAKDHHSSKPKMFREIIDALYPTGPRIELFAREKVKGWECWGNEAV